MPVSPTVGGGPGNHLLPGMIPGLPPGPLSGTIGSGPPPLGGGGSSSSAGHNDNDSSMQEDPEEEAPSPVGSNIPRGPSPEPRIEDSECHRSQSAM